MTQKKSMYRVQEIDEKWNEQMLSIVERSPIEAGGLKIVFDRRPDIFFLPRIRSKKFRCAGFFVRDRLGGFAMMLEKELFVKGTPQTVLYFGNLVVAPFARRKGFFYRLSDFFLKDLPENIRFGYAVILSGNENAKRLLNRFHPRYPNMPHSRIIGRWRVKNIILARSFCRKSKYTVRHARMEDIGAIARLLGNEYKTRLFGPVVTPESILENLKIWPDFSIDNYYVAEAHGEIVGVCCAWDMAPVKKNRVLSYGRQFAWKRALIHFSAPFFHYPKLPANGEPFREVTITDYAVRDRNPDILQALLLKIFREYRQKRYHLLIFGFPEKDPLGVAVRPFPSQSVVSEIILFSKSQEWVDRFSDPSLPLVDMLLL